MIDPVPPNPGRSGGADSDLVRTRRALARSLPLVLPSTSASTKKYREVHVQQTSP